MRLGVAKVAKAIGIPATKWPARCFEISTKIVEAGLFPGGTAVYGHWTGPVSPKSLFAKKPVVRHGWIQGPDGSVIDPTRFVFEAVKPYIYAGPNDYYDEGGDALRKLMRKPPPAFDATQPTFFLSSDVLSSPAWFHVMELLQFTEEEDAERDLTEVCRDQLLWLASAPYEELGPRAKDIYLCLEKLGKRTYVPIDNWRRAMAET